MDLALTKPIPLPAPKTPLTIRPATLDDIPFMDRLQKLHTKQVGWMPTKQFEGKINAGHVLIAESVVRDSCFVDREEGNPRITNHEPRNTPFGYCIGNDQYFKRDDVGIIYQMNVVPGKQRGLIGASLLKAQFERSAYGCKLYCCWCAQDIAANRFWEAMGFVPLAFRSGGVKRGERGKGTGVRKNAEASPLSPAPLSLPPSYARTHIFWQKRIRSGDTTTPWWFPSQTSGGSIREDRLVLPIPPGTHWSDAKPMILPGNEGEGVRRQGEVKQKQLPSSRTPKPETRTPVVKKSTIEVGGLRFGPPPSVEPVKDKPKREPKRKVKNDPKLIAAARELRDRWLEQVNATPSVGCGKYDVSRLITGQTISIETLPTKLLAA